MLGRIKNKPTLRNTIGNLQNIMDKEKNRKSHQTKERLFQREWQ